MTERASWGAWVNFNSFTNVKRRRRKKLLTILFIGLVTSQ
jgi:hypothetical protein